MSTLLHTNGTAINNPGNLRAAYGMKYPTKLNPHGFAIFQSMGDGCTALASLTFDYYTHHGYRTLFDFISIYAPASENDVQAYIRQVCILTGWSPLSVKTRDMLLDRSWNALELMRAIVIVENGTPPTDWMPAGEWIDLTTWIASMNRSGRWRCV